MAFRLKDDWKISLYFEAILNEPGLLSSYGENLACFITDEWQCLPGRWDNIHKM